MQVLLSLGRRLSMKSPDTKSCIVLGLKNKLKIHIITVSPYLRWTHKETPTSEPMSNIGGSFPRVHPQQHGRGLPRLKGFQAPYRLKSSRGSFLANVFPASLVIPSTGSKT